MRRARVWEQRSCPSVCLSVCLSFHPRVRVAPHPPYFKCDKEDSRFGQGQNKNRCINLSIPRPDGEISHSVSKSGARRPRPCGGVKPCIYSIFHFGCGMCRVTCSIRTWEDSCEREVTLGRGVNKHAAFVLQPGKALSSRPRVCLCEREDIN